MRVITGEAIVRANTFGSHLNITCADLRVHARECGAWIVVCADQSECHYTAAAVVHSDCRISDVVARNGYITLLEQLPRIRVHHEISYAGFGRSSNAYPCIKRAPEFPVGEIHLLHARIVAVDLFLNVGERTSSSEEVTPAPTGGV